MIENEDYVVCKICGKHLGSVNALHLRTHKITVDEYVSQYKDAIISSRKTVLKRNEKLKGREITWASKISESNKKSWKDNPLQGRTGIPLSEDSREKLSQKLQGHEVDQETRDKIGKAGLGREPWNKGLTSEVDDRLKSVAQKVSDWNKEFMTDEKKQQISRTLKNNYANGMSIGQSKNGFRVDLTMSFRSSWEANYARVLLYENKDIIYETDRFVLKDISGEIEHVYITDFKISDTHYIEIKGHADSALNWKCDCLRCQRDKNKLKLMNEQYPNIHVEIIGKKEYTELCRRYNLVIENWEFGKYDKLR